VIPTATGRLVPTASGHDLALTREFRAPIDDVWDSVTQPERVARWFGHWSGEAGPGKTISLTMTAEDGAPTSDVTITACTPPQHLAVAVVDEQGTWHLELHLSEQGGVTTLELVHHLAPDAPVGEVGPGWEFYLDRLVASREAAPMPDFDDYYPSLKDHFDAQRGGG
jgi:uncharacterized protein YndB with AHSA1/START domain